MTDKKDGGISIGNIGGDLSGNVAGNDITMGDKYTENKSGDTITVTGGTNVNIKSTLTNVTQTVGALPDGAAKQELEQLLVQLETLLQQVPAEQTQEAEAVAQVAGSLVEQATGDQPNKVMVGITAESLKQAAKNIVQVVPAVVDIAGKIVGAVMKLPGVS